VAINTGVNVSKLVGYAVLGVLDGVNVTKVVSYAVLEAASAPVWPSYTAPDGIKDNAYSWSFSATGATSIAVQSGSLPTGLSLSGSGSSGTISGTPTALGTFAFTLRASNSYGTADIALSITINAPASGGGSFTFVN
jgi:hypothetical protein